MGDERGIEVVSGDGARSVDAIRKSSYDGAGSIEYREHAIPAANEAVIRAARVHIVTGDRTGRINAGSCSALTKACAGAGDVKGGDGAWLGQRRG